jgi:HK97 family phage portal protein
VSRLIRYEVTDRRLSPFRRLVEAIRSYTVGPIGSSSHDLGGWVREHPTSTGLRVDEFSALNYSAVWTAVNLISADASSLPLVLYKRVKGGKERFTTHPLYSLLHDAPNPEMTSVVWRHTMQAHVLTWGNGYSEIERDQMDRPVALWPITPDRVTPFRIGPRAPLQYRVTNGQGPDTVLDAADVLHVPGMGWDGTQGYSVIQKARESIGLGLGTEAFGGAYFGNGAQMGGVISVKGNLTDTARQDLRTSLNSRHRGVENAHKFLLLSGDTSYTPLSVPPDDSQFLETRKFQIEEIARWFKIPPHKLGELTRSTNNNIEQQTIDYYTTTLLPWLTVWEQELTRKLVSPLERNQQFVEHIFDALLRADASARASHYSTMFSVGGVTPNEIRSAENRNEIDGGNRSFVPLNLVPLDRLDEWLTAKIDLDKANADKLTAEAESARRPPPPPPPPSNDQTQTDQVASLQRDVDLARRKAQEHEDRCDVLKATLEEARILLLREQDAHETTRDEGRIKLDALGATLNETMQRAVEAQAAFETAEAQRVELALKLAVTEEARDEQQVAREWADTDVITARAAVTAMTADLEAARARATAAETERATLAEQLTERDALITDERRANDEAHVLLNTTREDVAALRTTLTVTEGRLADAVAEADTRQRALDALDDRLRQATVAVTDAAVDALQRVIVKEADRARKAAGTPEKLAKWTETFYDLHRESVRSALTPMLRALAHVTGSQCPPVDDVVEQYVQDSRQQFRALAAAHDADSLAPAVERLLRRWESDRAKAMLDRIRRTV